MKKIQNMLELRERQQSQQVNHLREIIKKMKNTFQQERNQMGIEIQGLTLENKNLKNENKRLKDDESKITEIAPDPMKTMETINSRLLDRIDQLKTKNEHLEGMMTQLFDDPTPSILPMTPEKPKTLSAKKKSSVMDVNETPRKSRRLMKGSKKKKSHVRTTPRKSGRKLSFKK